MKKETKICNTCNLEKSIDLYGVSSYKRRDGTRSLKPTCNRCLSNLKKTKTDKIKNTPEYKEKNRERAKIWREKNRAKCLKKLRSRNATPEHKEYMKQWRKNNAEKVRESARKRNKKYVKDLTDMYVVNKLTCGSLLTAKDIRQHPELIEAHRENIKLKRKLNNNYE